MGGCQEWQQFVRVAVAVERFVVLVVLALDGVGIVAVGVVPLGIVPLEFVHFRPTGNVVPGYDVTGNVIPGLVLVPGRHVLSGVVVPELVVPGRHVLPGLAFPGHGFARIFVLVIPG